MNPKKRKSERVGKKGKRVGPCVIREYAGDYVQANFWIKIGLTRKQQAAVSEMGRAWPWCKDNPTARAARWLVMFGLECFEHLAARAGQLNNYAEAEGLSDNDVSRLLDANAERLAETFAPRQNRKGKSAK